MLLTEYASLLQSRAVATRDAYLRVLRQFIKRLGERLDNNGQFQPLQLTHTALESYFAHLEAQGGKVQEIDLVNEVRRALFKYDQQRSQTTNNNNPYFFSSQRSDRLSEPGIHHWFRQLKPSLAVMSGNR